MVVRGTLLLQDRDWFQQGSSALAELWGFLLASGIVCLMLLFWGFSGLAPGGCSPFEAWFLCVVSCWFAMIVKPSSRGCGKKAQIQNFSQVVRSHRCACGGFGPVVRLFVALCACCRVGEASHPGPVNLEQDQFCWHLGLCNPSGVNSKYDQLSHQAGDIWLVCESHLTKHGYTRFRKGLNQLQSPFKYTVPGAPCQPRSESDVGGFSGVLTLSRFPARPLPNDFDASLFNTGRIQVSGICVHGLWVTAGLVYGFPDSPTIRNRTFQTECLLDEVVRRVGSQTIGPRVVAGDFNHGPSELKQLELLRSYGFRELQEIALCRWGREIVATGRGSKNIDQVWVSPELQSLLLDVQIEHDVWAGHSTVSGIFASQNTPLVESVWRMPTSFSWPSMEFFHPQCDWTRDLTKEYASFWFQHESAAAEVIPESCARPPSRSLGRGATLSSHKVWRNHPPCRMGREGDIQPSFFGSSRIHSQWFRQLRRVQSLLRMQQSSSLKPSHLDQLHSVWKAIGNAQGFDQGFPQWWIQQKNLQVPVLPIPPPDVWQLEVIFQVFQHAVRRFESLLSQTRYRQAQLKRVKDVNLIFQDCARASPDKVDSLVLVKSFKVDEVCEDEIAIEAKDPVVLFPEIPLVCHGKAYPVLHAEPDKLWLESVDGLTNGDELIQQKVLCSDQDIMNEFVSQWSSRWIKLDHLLPSQWDQIVAFTAHHFQPLQWNFPTWTGDRIHHVAKHKKKRAATGPDGVSRADILALSKGSVNCLADMFNAIEETSQWPCQLTRGFVNSLFKNKGDGGVDSYRPITVFPFLYRIWSTARSHDLMATLRKALPKSVLGGVPGRQSKAIWFEVSQLMEASYIHSQSLQGLVLDIRRAFNCIPRYPIWNLLSVLGLPTEILKTWASFVSGQSRMFRVRASSSDPIQSCVGFPEGCALSVTAMVLIDWLLDKWISVTCGEQIGLYFYIDDWHATFANALTFPNLWRNILDFACAVDLQVDAQKSFLWAVQATERKLLQEAEFGVTLAARDLGVHHNFCRKAGNKTLTDRIRELEGVWSQLRTSPSSYRLKLKVIMQLAWPRALFGLSVVHLGSCHYGKLRSGAMRGLSSNRVGSNPALHLSSQNLLLDPECWGLLQTLRDVREVGNIPLMEAALLMLQQQPGVVPGNGPASILNSRVAKLGWHLSNGGIVTDIIGSFNMFSLPWEAVMHRVHLAWPRVLATEVSHRASFSGIQHADLFSVKNFLRTLGDADKVYALCALDGTLYQDVTKTKENRGAHSRCCFCNSIDSFFHRLWQCEAFSSCRAGFKWTSLLTSLPACLTCHGWAILPCAWVDYQVMLNQLPEPFFQVDWKHGPTDCIDLFTDGSCIAPACPRLRVASWAVTQAFGGPTSLDHRIIAGGWVTGTVQTSYRGELTAMLQALRAVASANRRARIWCDNDAVVKRTRWLLRGGVPPLNAPHSDLLQSMVAVIEESDLWVGVQIVKVVSHCDPSCADDDIDAWAFWQNMLVDRAACEINWRRPEGFWQQWERAKNALQFHEELHRDIMQVILKVGRFDPNAADAAPSLDKVVEYQQQVGCLDPIPQLGRSEWLPPQRLLDKYGPRNVMCIHEWWTAVVLPQLQKPKPLLWLSGVQLYLDFWFSTGHTGLLSPRHGIWFESDENLPCGFQPKLVKRSTMFLNVLLAYLKASRQVVPRKLQRPGSSVLAFWAMCYRLPWEVRRLEVVDGSLMSLLNRQAGRPNDLAGCEVPMLPNVAMHLFRR